jgi:hypothetical protein
MTIEKGHREPKSALLARRSFLKAVGAAATAFPFYKMLEDNVAYAQSGQLPLKFVGMAGWHGTTQKFYTRRAGEALGMDTPIGDIAFADSCLRPFDQSGTYGYSFKNKINIFEAFDFGVGRIANFDYGNGMVGEINVGLHGSMGFFLTGSAPSDGIQNTMYHTLQNASLDQYLAGLYGGMTPFRSIEMKTESTELGTFGCLAAGPGGALLSFMTSPQAIWDRCFANLMPSNNAAADHKRAVGKSVLDFALGDLQRLQSRLAGPEKAKLDQHLTVVRGLENQLASLPSPTVCTPPARHVEGGSNTSASDYYITGTTNNAGITYLNRVADFQIELLAQILICDLTRFATLVLPNFAGDITGTPMITNLDGTAQVTGSTYTDISVPADFHIEIAHKADDGNVTDVGLNVHQAVAAVQRYYHSKVARLMQRLQDAGVLDNTIILMGNEGGMGAAHQIRHVPIVMAGGANGALRMGRRIVAPGRLPRCEDYATTSSGGGAIDERLTPTSHNPILVAVANTFHAAAGAPLIDSFGTCTLHPDMTKGVPGLV